jgi:hypothetical protein
MENQMTLKDLQRVMSPDSDTVIIFNNVARAPSEVIPRTRQTIGAKKAMIMIFLTACQLILLDVLPKEANLVSSISPIPCFPIEKRKT